VNEAEATAALLCRQFDSVVAPNGKLIHARRKIAACTSETGVFIHCGPAAVLGAKHDRLERLLEVRARLELTRLVAEQVQLIFVH